MADQVKPCVFCGKVNDFLMACEGVCLRCHDRLRAEHGLYVGPQAAVDSLRAERDALANYKVAFESENVHRARAQKTMGLGALGKSYLEAALDERDSLAERLRDMRDACSEPIGDDPRMSYVEVQIGRQDWDKLFRPPAQPSAPAKCSYCEDVGGYFVNHSPDDQEWVSCPKCKPSAPESKGEGNA